MTNSKEALDWLYQVINNPVVRGGNLEDNNNALKIIQNDLKMLELLKNHLYIGFNRDDNERQIKANIYDTDYNLTNYNKIKDWLNDDN